jgi:aryl-alcohol dehydrogenase-like predicted oxidoreductase
LDDLRAEGKVHTTSLSTHDRPLALQAMSAGWNPVMVRHSAAHRGAETTLFPQAVALGISLLTFNNTCYGRLLRAHGPTPPPSAADCYRYALEQPGVSACWTAPATLEQLEANLEALVDPVLPAERRTALLAHGAAVYAEDTAFRQLVRSR